MLRQFPGIGNLQVLQLLPGADLRVLLGAYQQSGLVEYAEPDFIVHATLEPNDFRYSDGSLWGLHNTGLYGGRAGADIDAPNGWDIQSTAGDIVVAVIDTGARYTHEDLAANCARLGRWQFQLVIAPLKLQNGTGSPVNPIAIF